MRFCLFLILVALLSIKTFSQQHKADSLRQVIASTSNDSLKIDAYLGFYDLYQNSHPDSVKYYLNQGLLFTRKIRDLKNHAYLSTFLAFVDYRQGAFVEAHQILDRSLALVKGNPEYLSSELKLLNWKSVVLQGQRKIDSAQVILTKIVDLSDDFPLEQLKAHLILGNIELRKLHFQRALYFYHNVDSICQANQFESNACVSALANSGLVLMEIGQLDESLKYLEKATQKFLHENDEIGVLAISDDMARIHLKKGNLDLAEKILVERNARLKESNSYKLEVQGLKVLNKVYREQSNFEEALPVLNRALSLSEKINDTVSITEVYIDYGKFYTETQAYDQAGVYADKVIDLLDTSHQIELLDEYYQLEYRISVFEILVAIQLGNKDFKTALGLNEELQEFKDKFSAVKDARTISDIESKYQNEKKQKEIELLTSKAQLVIQKARNQRNLLIAGISILGLAFVTVFLLFRNKQKTNQRLRELESAKSKFFANISHEFRTPLTLISGPVAHQLSKDDLSSDDKTDLGLIQRNANQLLKFVDQILDLSKIEAGRRKLRVSKGNLDLFLKHLIEPFRYQAKKKDVTFNDIIDIQNEVWFDRDVVDKIVANLLSNALKYNQNKEKIVFKAVAKNQELILTTINGNDDLTEKELPLLFDRFYQNNTIHQGFGIGLSLVKELATLSYGTVHAHRPDDKTIAFVVTLPLTKIAFSKEDLIMEDKMPEIIKKPNEEAISEPYEKDEELGQSSLPVLLVVDDNAEIRLFIKTLFKKEYHILEAENGEVGMQIALQTIPDLIISDIMMPIKDGIAMSNALKNDERTSHIPIVLLTAKSGEENELTGLKTGADAYMVKPFKEEKLRVIIEKLIATRTAIQEKFSKQSLMRIKGVELTKVDTRLMERIQQILDVELTNPEFNAKAFSEQVGLSRMHLHRKLKALTGLSTSEFIRVQRLKMAAKLLKEGHTNISEVGYATGFNQPAYFSTAFKQHFGYSPSEYATV
ncbi:response regulator [Flagellimonas allohymeniacidonis]|uniref:histidine kinase n=1 Tax=Flagellimonas allohymeniacidonis TaxID=2517819 RepID=A0A4Q8QJW4_9FLAO|nr:response regulator [Allomuricauda hymeniacidonis]TAI48526.1 response regulator [Allomuricauda hymeniacidonis]